MPAGIQFLVLFYNWSINYKYIDAVLSIRCDGKTELETIKLIIFMENVMFSVQTYDPSYLEMEYH